MRKQNAVISVYVVYSLLAEKISQPIFLLVEPMYLNSSESSRLRHEFDLGL